MIEVDGPPGEVEIGGLRWPMARIFHILHSNGYIDTIPLEQEVELNRCDDGKQCVYHQQAEGHDVESCEEFRRVVKKMIALRVLRIERESEVEEDTKGINMMDEGNDCTPKPLIIWYEEPSEVLTTTPMFIPQPITIQNPRTFHYKSNKVVPWNYDTQVSTADPHPPQTPHSNPQTMNTQTPNPQTPYLQTSNPQTLTPQPSPSTPPATDFISAIQGQVTYLPPHPLQQVAAMPTEDKPIDAVATGGMTRSGRIYLSEEVENRRKGKGKECESQETVEPGAEQVVKNKPVTDEEASEFLKLMKQSEYCIVEQLKKTPARISLLSLILTSEPHRQALQKVLNESYVMPDLEADKFGHMVNQIQAANYITFTDDEIDPAGTGHIKALHICLKCKGYTVAKVLIDNGSSLNVLPVMTLKLLPVDQSLIRPSRLLVKAFDGTKSEVVGDIDLDLEIGPHVFTVTFQIMNITPTYSMLLGRPWIHSAGAIPSSLHQKVKYVIDGKLVTIYGEESILVKSPSVPYIEASEEAIESSFQTFEIAMASYVPESAFVPRPSISQASLMMAKQMLRSRYETGKGLGAKLQGREKPLQLKDKQDRFGLRYKPSRKDHCRVQEEKREKRIARLQNREPSYAKIDIPHIRVTFPKPAYVVGSLEHPACFPRQTSVIISDLSEFTRGLSINFLEGEQEDSLTGLPTVTIVEQITGLQRSEGIEVKMNGTVQSVQVGTAQSEEGKNRIVNLIRQFADAFEWGLGEEDGNKAFESVAMVHTVSPDESEIEARPSVYLTPGDAPLSNWKAESLPIVFNSM